VTKQPTDDEIHSRAHLVCKGSAMHPQRGHRIQHPDNPIQRDNENALANASIPRQSVYLLSRSKQLVGPLRRPPVSVGHLNQAYRRHRFICSKRTSSCSWFRMYSRITSSYHSLEPLLSTS
jgi:hypothetical protein